MTAGRRYPLRFALLGANSGAISAVLLMALPQRWKIEIGDVLVVSSLSIVAGLVFGIIFGALLRYLGLATPRAAVLYALASTLSYFLAVNLALNLADRLEAIWQIGLIAGLAGAACLTALAAWLLPFARRIGPCALMLAAGCGLGALLVLPLRDGSGFADWFVFYGAWQAGYAAAFAGALPKPRA
jgi:hypothetical protein